MMVIAIRRIYKDMLFDLYKYRRKKHKQQQRKLRLQFCNPVSTGAWRCRGFLLSGSGLTETASTNKYIVTAKKSKSKSPLKNDKSLYVSIFEGIPKTQILAKFLENCRISPSWELPLSALFMFFFLILLLLSGRLQQQWPVDTSKILVLKCQCPIMQVLPSSKLT